MLCNITAGLPGRGEPQRWEAPVWPPRQVPDPAPSEPAKTPVPEEKPVKEPVP